MNSIIHVSPIKIGGTAKHIFELSCIFSDYSHIHTSWNDIIYIIEKNKPVLLHIHAMYDKLSGHQYDLLPYDDYINIMKKYVSLNIPIYITIHDYQWLYPDEPILVKETVMNVPKLEHVQLVEKIMNYADCIIFPSQSVHDNYIKYLHNIQTKHFVIPHCDIPIRMEQCYIPCIHNDKTINIAYVGAYIPYKGSKLFEELINCLSKNNPYGYNYKFHVYGTSIEGTVPDTVKYNGTFCEDSIIKQLHNDNIHLLCFFSVAEETYSYSLSIMINSGIPIVYLNKGSLQTRIYNSGPERFFCANRICDILQSTYDAIQFIIENQEKIDYKEMTTTAIVNDWYKQNYPLPSFKKNLDLF